MFLDSFYTVVGTGGRIAAGSPDIGGKRHLIELDQTNQQLGQELLKTLIEPPHVNQDWTLDCSSSSGLLPQAARKKASANTGKAKSIFFMIHLL